MKWLIQPECPVGSRCTWAWFSREGWALSEAEQGSGCGRAVCEGAGPGGAGLCVENEDVSPVVPCAMASGFPWKHQAGPEKSSG